MEAPEILTFNEGLDDILDSLFTPVLGIEETETPNEIAHHSGQIHEDYTTLTDNPSELASSLNVIDDDKRVTSPVSYIVNLFKPLTSLVRWRRSVQVILTVNATVTVTNTLTTTNTIFVQKCTPSPFTISTCLKRR